MEQEVAYEKEVEEEIISDTQSSDTDSSDFVILNPAVQPETVTSKPKAAKTPKAPKAVKAKPHNPLCHLNFLKQTRDANGKFVSKKTVSQTTTTTTTTMSSKKRSLAEVEPSKDKRPTKKQLVIDDTSDESDAIDNIIPQQDGYVSTAAFYNRPAETIVRDLTTALSGVMHQDLAKEEVFYRLYARIATKKRPFHASQRIVSLHLTGGSGVGKTQTAEKLAHSLGVGPGTAFPNHYHHISLTKYSDQSHAVAITGVAGGLVGYNDANLVVTLQSIATISSPFIILHFDEACKAHPAFINGLNPLLSEGEFADVKGKRFRVPDETLLIILWTSNFSEKFPDLFLTNPQAATRQVHEKMYAKGYDFCDIARMGGDPIFYRSLNTDDMYDIIDKNGNDRLSLHVFSCEYGVPSYREKHVAVATPVDRPNQLVRSVINTYRHELGVRFPMEKYRTELETLLTNAHLLAILHIKNTKKNKDKKHKPPTYWCRQVSIEPEDRINREAFIARNKSLATALRQNIKNKKHLDHILDDPLKTTVDYAVLKFYTQGNKMLAYSIFQPVTDIELVPATGLATVAITTMNASSTSNMEVEYCTEEMFKSVQTQNSELSNKYETLILDFEQIKHQLSLLCNSNTLLFK